jgi:ABC-type phosphate/phosphonate transport system substrate-binding protein
LKNYIFGILFFWVFTAAHAEPVMQFGVFPHLSPHQLLARYQPLADALSDNLSRSILLKTSRDFQMFQQKIISEQYDFALLQPLFYPDAHELYGYEPIVQLAEPLSAIVLVHKSAQIHNFSDLDNLTVALPSPLAAVTKLFEREIKQNGVKMMVRSVYTKSHDRCYQAVLSRQVDACVSADRSFKGIPIAVQQKFKEVARFGSIPHVILVVHKRVSESVRKNAAAFFLQDKIVPTVVGGVVKKANAAELDNLRVLLK